MRHGLSRAGAANRAVGPAGGGRRIWLTAVIAAVLFTLYGTPQAAWAHNALLGTTPADGAQVKMAPATVVLTFNEPAISTGTKVLVTGPDGPVAVGAPALIDNTVQQELKPGLPAGGVHGGVASDLGRWSSDQRVVLLRGTGRFSQ